MKATDIRFICHSIGIDILPVKELIQKDGQPRKVAHPNTVNRCYLFHHTFTSNKSPPIEAIAA
jgi:hypothetical protein